ncbi:MAG: hypothetical protein LUQ16_02580 [Methanomassiliicoccales archaeon]|nr:hypothetical protein [Methanomassiliicoccales archaeon]MDD1756304.1 hypothetical protein [Methanomassiliicoccales archaeon]
MTGDHCAFLYNEEFPKYYFGENHPWQPHRDWKTRELLEGMGIFGDHAIIYKTQPATEQDLLMVHSQQHIDFVKKRCQSGGGLLDRGDTPATETLYEGSLAAVGATLDGVEGIVNGRFLHAFNPAGGLHHARSECSSGFCVFNDIAVAVRALQRRFKKERVAIIDIDGHHGDGTQSVFYKEKILTVSLHHLSSGFYPGTGNTRETGEGYGKGYAINVPLPFRTGDGTYLKAYREIVMTALDEYRPDMIIHQFGVDAHFSDPLVGLGLTTHAYESIAKMTHDAAHRLCNGQYMVVGGGGYNLEAVPRCWAIMFCTISGVYPKDMKAFEALHDKQGMPEPEEVPGEVDETIRRLKAEALPLIK